MPEASRAFRAERSLAHGHVAPILGKMQQLKLDELITKTYSLDQINEGYQDLRDGTNIRGVIALS